MLNTITQSVHSFESSHQLRGTEKPNNLNMYTMIQQLFMAISKSDADLLNNVHLEASMNITISVEPRCIDNFLQHHFL